MHQTFETLFWRQVCEEINNYCNAIVFPQFGFGGHGIYFLETCSFGKTTSVLKGTKFNLSQRGSS